MGKITSIVYKPATDDAGVGDYVRVPIGDAVLIAGHGIEGDLKGGGPGRNLNILSQESVDWLVEQGFNGAPGAFGEQLVISGVDVDALGNGATLRLGESALVKVDRSRNGCSKLEANQGQPKERSSGRLGVMADVIQGGAIKVGDEAALAQSEPEGL